MAKANKVIITCAVPGSIHTPSMSPYLPITAEEIADAADQFAEARTSPGVVLPGAYGAAFASLSALSATNGTWREETTRPYDSDDPRYRDPEFSNSSGGAGRVAGRMTGLAVGGGALYAGALAFSVCLLRASEPFGLVAIAMLFAIVWGTDVFAYFAKHTKAGRK